MKHSFREHTTFTIKRHIRRHDQVREVNVTEPILITEKSVRRFTLMQEDYIMLVFSLANTEPIAIGDFVDDELFGRFFVTEEQMPKYNQQTGGYDYSLRLNAEYMLWKNWIHCLTVEAGGELQRMESEWSLTDRLEVHAQQIADEVNLIMGATYTVSINLDPAKAAEIHCLSYNGKTIFEALNMIAEAWQCEWWVTYDNEVGNEGEHLHFGKMENGNTPYDFRLGENVESMDIARDQQSYATRIYAYGGTQNIPATYDRDLVFTVDTVNPNNLTGFKDSTRELKVDMIDGVPSVQPRIIHFGNPQTTSAAHEQTDVYTTVAETFSGNVDLSGFLKFTCRANKRANVSVMAKLINNGEEIDISGELSKRTQNNTTIYSYKADIDMTLRVVGQLMFEVEWNVVLPSSSTETLDVEIDEESSITAMPDINEGDIGVDVMINGVKHLCTLHGGSGLLTFNGDGVNVAQGTKYTILNVNLNVPLSYFTPIYDTGTLSKVGEKRLHLPLGDYPNRYLPTDIPFDMAQCVEMAVAFNTLRIKPGSLGTTQMRDRVDYPDGSVQWLNWTQYSFQLQRCTDEANRNLDSAWEDLDFKISYMLDGAKLQAAFTAPKSMHDGGFMLSGMTFDVGFADSNGVKTYTIIRNEDYGVKLPNDLLKPTERDELFLTGWNPKAMEELHLVEDAEQELARKAQEYYEAIQEGQFTFTCRMMSGWAFSNADGGTFIEFNKHVFRVMPNEGEISDSNPRLVFTVASSGTEFVMPVAGDVVNVYSPALPNGVKRSRILGYEFKLDMPFDTPTYTVGETEAFSRLKQIEKQLTKLS